MPNDSGIIDVWTQYLSPTPPDKRTAAAENVFRNYGRLDWYHNGTDLAQMLADMDRNEVQIACISGEPEHVREAVRRHPDRFIGEYHADPTNIMAAVRGLQEHVEKYGFKVLRIEPFMWRKPPTDPCYYPLYAKCVELDVAFQTQVGHTGPLFPSETGRPIYIDQVALDFPELRIVMSHAGYPWVLEACLLVWKHPNVYLELAAHRPKYFTAPGAGWEPLLRYGQTTIQDKVLYGTGAFLIGARPADLVAEFQALPVKREVMEKWCWKNAAALLGVTDVGIG